MLYLRLALVALCPVVISVVLYLLEKKTTLKNLDRRKKQLLYGLIFGGLAVLATEFGVPIPGAVINVRDAAPLCAGLLFGAPAGIIAGLIGGVERWFAVFWGAGAYTQMACSVSTIFAGFFAAALRKWMFDDKIPAWYYGFGVALVTEILHMLMIFFTNMGDVQMAFSFVKICSAPMILTNAFAVMFAVLFVSLLGKEKSLSAKGYKRLSQSFSKWLLLVVIVAFCVTSVFTFALQTKFSVRNNESRLMLNIEDVKADIKDASDENLLQLTKGVAADIDAASVIDNDLLLNISEKPGNDFSEINVVNEKGLITSSTNPAYIGFDMTSGEQARAFLGLLYGEDEFVQDYQPISKNGLYMKYAGVALADGGFVQVGYDAERFQKDIDGQVIGATRNRHVGENGYIIIAGNDWNIVSDPGHKEGQNLEQTGIWIDTETMPENTRFECAVYGDDCYCMYAVTEGYYIIAVEPAEEALFARNLSVYVTVFMEILVFAALFILIYFLIKKLVVENIHKINGTLGEITGGNLDVAVDVRTNEEFVSLSDDINSTVVTLKGYIDEAAARIDQELEFARAIQLSALPGVFPPFPERNEFDLFAQMLAAKEVGGDFYDYFFIDNDRLALVIADVSGKGIPAALFMMKSKTLLKSLAETATMSSAEILSVANRELCQGNDAEMFVTVWLGILDIPKMKLTCASAGHEYPALRRQNGPFELLRDKHGLVLAVMDDSKYVEYDLDLTAGDCIFVYTDGVTEATNAEEELFGEERLLTALNINAAAAPEELLATVKSQIDVFVADAPQFDDITMLCLKIREAAIPPITP